MARPRIVLAPALTELEWPIRSDLAEWADVASYDAPGVGAEAPPASWDLEAVVARGLEEVDRRGWDEYFVVGDEFGSVVAVHLAAARPQAVAGLALGHACIGFPRAGEGPPSLTEEVMGSFERLLHVDYRTYVRHLTQLTRGAYDDAIAEEFMARVPHRVALAYEGAQVRGAGDLESLIRSVEAPLLLAQHEGCLGFTDEGYARAVAAFPHAQAAGFAVKPSASEEFADALREFCTAAAGQAR